MRRRITKREELLLEALFHQGALVVLLIEQCRRNDVEIPDGLRATIEGGWVLLDKVKERL